MAVRIVRLGSKRVEGEGLRIGTVRRPPRGVPKERHAADDWYDVWLPNLAPSVPVMQLGLHANTPTEVQAFKRKYRAEMNDPQVAHVLAALAALSSQTDFSVGCYCEDETRCHRSVLRELLMEKGAQVL